MFLSNQAQQPILYWCLVGNPGRCSMYFKCLTWKKRLKIVIFFLYAYCYWKVNTFYRLFFEHQVYWTQWNLTYLCMAKLRKIQAWNRICQTQNCMNTTSNIISPHCASKTEFDDSADFNEVRTVGKKSQFPRKCCWNLVKGLPVLAAATKTALRALADRPPSPTVCI